MLLYVYYTLKRSQFGNISKIFVIFSEFFSARPQNVDFAPFSFSKKHGRGTPHPSQNALFAIFTANIANFTCSPLVTAQLTRDMAV
jgi:hypothetical protein